MKTTYNLNKFCKAADNDIIYEETADAIAVCDKKGAIGMYIIKEPGKPCTVLDQLRTKKSVKVAEAAKGLANTLRSFVFAKVEHLNARDTEIRIPVRTCGIKRMVAAIQICEDCSFKFIDEKYMGIFDYDLLSTTENKNSPLVAVCMDCFGIVCPVAVDKDCGLPTEYLTALTASLTL